MMTLVPFTVVGSGRVPGWLVTLARFCPKIWTMVPGAMDDPISGLNPFKVPFGVRNGPALGVTPPASFTVAEGKPGALACALMRTCGSALRGVQVAE